MTVSGSVAFERSARELTLANGATTRADMLSSGGDGLDARGPQRRGAAEHAERPVGQGVVRDGRQIRPRGDRVGVDPRGAQRGDVGVGEQPLDVAVGVARHPLDVEPVERGAEVVPLAQDDQPGQPALERFRVVGAVALLDHRAEHVLDDDLERVAVDVLLASDLSEGGNEYGGLHRAFSG